MRRFSDNLFAFNFTTSHACREFLRTYFLELPTVEAQYEFLKKYKDLLLASDEEKAVWEKFVIEDRPTHLESKVKLFSDLGFIRAQELGPNFIFVGTSWSNYIYYPGPTSMTKAELYEYYRSGDKLEWIMEKMANVTRWIDEITDREEN